MVESSNALGGNDAEGTVDFVAGGLVAGVSSWTDYRMTTRMIAGDDDGFGVYIRYKDAANFYRIAFRSQDNVTTGVPEGVSVQKAVDGFYETGKISFRGKEMKVKAPVKQFEFSGHGDRTSLFDMIKNIKGDPKVLAVHGDENSCTKFAEEIQEKFGLDAYAPKLGEEIAV